MVLTSPSEPLSQLEVLVVDCQATAAAPRGHLLEIGWARVLGTTITHAHASLIALPDGEQIPPAGRSARARRQCPSTADRIMCSEIPVTVGAGCCVRLAATLASFDRLRVLTTELKRLIAARAPVALRLGVGPALDESRLASALWWL